MSQDIESPNPTDTQKRAARWNALGDQVRNGNAAEVVAQIDAAAAEEPQFWPGHFLRGVAHLQLGRFAAAADAATRAIALKPDAADAHQIRILALVESGETDSAIAACRTALAAVPDDPRTGPILARQLLRIGDLQGADDAADEMFRLHPNDPACVFEAANINALRHRWSAARRLYARAAALMPTRPEGDFGVAGCLLAEGRFAEARAGFERAIALDPKFEPAWINRLYLSTYDPSIDPQQCRALHEEWARNFADGLVPDAPAVRRARNAEKRLKIGFVSPDFRRHSVTQFVRPIFAWRDPAQIEIHAYSNVAQPDATTEALRAMVDAWHPIEKLDDAAAAAQVRSDGIDILVDLAAHTSGGRLGIFARKPAPVQATWLGYCATTGLKAIDWFVTDGRIVPAGAEDAFVERIWRLPHAYCYVPQEAMPEVSSQPCLRLGRPTFGHFGRIERINDATLAVWAAILSAVPDARLVLNSPPLIDGEIKARLAARFAAAGGDVQRLGLFATSPQPATWASYGEIDVALDCFPFNAGATTFEALWLGVPVVTMRAAAPLGRMGESILSAAGLGEWVAGDAAAYVAKAVDAVRAPGELAALRKDMRRRLLASPLMDQKRYARSFEAGLRGMWRAAVAEG
jgi:predicted O-linked N-acetylglucosamine transferase (SPINDLY family)